MLLLALFLFSLWTSCGLSAVAERYESHGDDCSQQPVRPATVTRGSYAGSVTARSPTPLEPWTPDLRPPCRPHHDPLSPSVQGTWLQTADKLYKFEPANCMLPRLTAAKARQCLAHKTLAFVGDSVTRYQFVSLAYFLSKTWPMQPFADNLTDHSFAHEHQWPDWPSFWQGLVQTLACAVDAQGYASCNGHRNKTTPFREVYESHELRLRVQQPNSLASTPLRLVANMAMQNPDYVNNLMQSLEHVMREARPDVLVLNGGVWYDHYPVQELTEQAQGTFMQVHKRILGHALSLKAELQLSTLLVWKTTTASSQLNETNWGLLQDLLVLEAVALGWEVHDARSVSLAGLKQGMNMHIDSFHFIPFVYQELNDLLLYQICRLVSKDFFHA